jgi:inorganic pyrophosphatase
MASVTNSFFRGTRHSLRLAQVRQQNHAFRRLTARAYKSETKGEGLDFRMHFFDGSERISPWHDIPLKASSGTYNFVCEIPKETDAKMECATDEEGNPIKQDIKKGKLRFYPYNINWNYGFLPQTWEDPEHKNEECGGVFGDNDPLDVVEISSQSLKMGGVYPVKCVGTYAMIDDGELDWKVIAINAEDPLADKINDVEDVEREMPGELEKIMIWFRDYKTPDGKPQNEYGYDAKCMNAEFTEEVIRETNGLWSNLKEGKTENKKELALA